MELPVYLFTGFLESGKTTFIKEILKDEDFVINNNSLLILCEEGIEEFEEDELKKVNTTVITVENEEDLNSELIKKYIRFLREIILVMNSQFSSMAFRLQ